MAQTSRDICEKIRAQLLFEINKTVPILRDMHHKYKVHPPEKRILVIDTKATIARDAVRTHARKLVKYVEMWEADLLRQIDETVENKRTIVENNKVKYQGSLQNIARLASTLSHIADQSDSEVLHYDGKFSGELDVALNSRPLANDTDVEELTFVDNPNSASFIHEGFGFLKVCGIDAAGIQLTKSTILVSLGCTYTVGVKVGVGARPEMEDNLTFTVLNLFSREKFRPASSRLSKGVFECSFRAENPGVYQFQVQFLGTDVNGSPFIFFVFDRKPDECVAESPSKVEGGPFDLSDMELVLQQLTTIPLNPLNTKRKRLSSGQRNASALERYLATRSGKSDGLLAKAPAAAASEDIDENCIYSERDANSKTPDSTASFGVETCVVRESGSDCVRPPSSGVRTDTVCAFRPPLGRGQSHLLHSPGAKGQLNWNCYTPPPPPPPNLSSSKACDTDSAFALSSGNASDWYQPESSQQVDKSQILEDLDSPSGSVGKYEVTPQFTQRVVEDMYVGVQRKFSLPTPSKPSLRNQSGSDSSSYEEEMATVAHRDNNVAKHSQKPKSKHQVGPARTLPQRKKGSVDLVRDRRQCGNESVASTSASNESSRMLNSAAAGNRRDAHLSAHSTNISDFNGAALNNGSSVENGSNFRASLENPWSPNASRAETGMSDTSLPVGASVSFQTAPSEQCSLSDIGRDEWTRQADQNIEDLGSSTDRAADLSTYVTPLEQATVLDKFFRGRYAPAVKGASLKAKFVRKISDEHLQYPIGIEVDSLTQDIWLCDTGSDKVKKFSWLGHLLLVIGEHKKMFRRPSAIRLNKDGELFIKDDVQIHVFSKDYAFKKAFGKGLMVKPYGLQWTHDGNLLTLDQGKFKTRILVFSQAGTLLTDCVLEPLAQSIPGSKVRFFGVSLSRLVISDLGLSTIYITDLKGKELAYLGSFGKAAELYNEPSGIAIDRSGNAIIGDSKNNRLQVYRNDFEYGGILQLDSSIVRPSDIFLTNDDHLLVVNFLQHCIKVFQLIVE